MIMKKNLEKNPENNSTKEIVDIRILLKKGLKVVFSSHLFFFFGMFIAVPKTLLLIFFQKEQVDLVTDFILEENLKKFPEYAILFLLAVFLMIVLGSIGATAIVFFTNVHEKNKKTKISLFKKDILKRAWMVFQLEILLIMIVLLSGVFLTLPVGIASMKGLNSLSDTLSLSATGLILSISLLLFFIRQYAIMYLSLSLITVSVAIENSYRLFQKYLKETFLFSASIFAINFSFMFLIVLFEFFLEKFFGASLIIEFFDWLVILCVFSFFEAWNWSSWTIFFRTIALPKEPDLVLQKVKNMIQQDSVISLDKV